MHIDYRRLRAIVCLADEGSFSRAAARMHVSQPALSAQIQKLEGQLGFKVFERSTRQVALTANGRLLLEEAKYAVEACARVERLAGALRRKQETRLLVGAPIYTIDFPDRVRYLENLTETSVDTQVEIATVGSQTEVMVALAAGHLDLAILMGVPISCAEYRQAVSTRAGRETVFDESLRAVVLAEQPVHLLVPADTTLARQQRINPGDLNGQRVAVLQAFHGAALYVPIERYLLNAGAELVFPPEPNAIGVERYGRRFGIPAISLGWFPQSNDTGMVRRPLVGLDLCTRLVLAGHPEVSTPAIEQAFALAERLKATEPKEQNERKPERSPRRARTR